MEFILFICALKLTNASAYMWIAVAVLSALFGLTAYAMITELISVLGKLQKKLAESYKEQMEGIFQQIAVNDMERNDKIEYALEQQKVIYKDAIDRLAGLESENLHKLEESYKNWLDENSIHLVSKCEELLEEAHNKYVKSIEEQSEAFSGNVNHLQKACQDVFMESQKKTGEQIAGFVKEISEVNRNLLSENARESKALVQDSSTELYRKCETLMRDLINQYNDVMGRYKEEFVEANIEALAKAEKTNLDIITKAHQDISVLKEAMEKTEAKNGENIRNMMYLLGEIEKCIENGISKRSEQFEDFNEDFDEEIQKMSKAIKKQFQEYLDTISEYREDIMQISERIEYVTKEYKELFHEVRKNQQEMNNLTKEDINLLNELMKK